MSFVDQTLSNDVFISIVRPSQQKLVTQLTKRTVVAPTGTHDQVLSDDLCVRLCRYCLGTHSGQLRQSLNCANGPYNPSVAEAGTRSQVVHAGGIEEFGIRASEVVTAAAPWGFDCESNKKTKARRTRSQERRKRCCAEIPKTVPLSGTLLLHRLSCHGPVHPWGEPSQADHTVPRNLVP